MHALLIRKQVPWFALVAIIATFGVVGSGPSAHASVATPVGVVSAWGSNADGQLGDGSTADQHLPITVNNLSGIVSIAGGLYHSIAVKSDGTVWAWGNNVDGELGYLTNGSYNSVPQQVGGLSNVIKVSAGEADSVALKIDGTVWAWGSNSNGQLGNDFTHHGITPTQVNGLSNVISIASGWDFNLALKSDGTVWAWGANSKGQLGDNTTIDNAIPQQVNNLSGVIAIGAGKLSSYAVKTDGTLWAWGWNSYGQLGVGSTTDASAPVQVTSLSHVLAVAGGQAHALAVTSDGNVWAWGLGSSGELGDNSTASSSVPVQASGISNAIAVTGGGYFSAAVKLDGTVWEWGANYDGQLGDNSTTDVHVPIQATGISGVNAAAAGYNHLLAVRIAPSGSVVGSGYNFYGQLGNGQTFDSHVPVQTLQLNGVVGVSAGGFHSLAVRSDGTVWAWGNNLDGQLGNNSISSSSLPVQANGLSAALAVAGGRYHSLALRSDGTVWAWGNNNSGQLGDGLVGTDSHVPVQVTGLNSVVAIAAGGDRSAALKSDGTVWSWGSSYLGNGTPTSSSVPVEAIGLTNIEAIAMGESHTLALKSDGTVWAWGYNYYGEVGDNSQNYVVTPLQVSGLSNVIAIAAGLHHSLALRSDGTLWAWGDNSNGQLGDNSTTNSLVPVQVSGNMAGVFQIAGGGYHSLALRSDGVVFAWGDNSNGQLGDNSTTDSHVPIQSNFSGLNQISGGELHTVGLTPIQAPTIASSITGTTITTSTVTLTGTAPPNSLIEIFDNGNLIGQTSSDGAGNWSIPVTLNNGYHVISVVAVDSNGNQSSPSGSINFIVLAPPSAPLNLSATADNTKVGLSWSAPSNTAGSAVIQYNIYRSTAPNSEQFLTQIGEQQSFTDSGLVNGTTYYYKVSAVTIAGEGPLSSEISVLPYAPPTAPLNLKAVPGSNIGDVSLSWSPPSYNGGIPLRGYNIFRGTSPDKESLLTQVSPGTTSFTDSGLQILTNYYYKVSAYNLKEGPQSNESCSLAFPWLSILGCLPQL
ncbi:MAG: RCC1 domain-containing protein [Actinomycetota bacterium]